ncbi:MAG: SoxR reducing system RseC family protein [Pseudomonadota bacterium]|nr:MAG: SoxR reducing system RseC family protein [Pseudomonadota bacterium]
MIEQAGIVVRVDGERAWVETERRSSCGDCSAQAGCGHALLGKTFGRKFAEVQVVNNAHLKPGECNVLGVREDALLKSSFAVYLIPLLGLLLGALVGATAVSGVGDLSALLGGVAGFVAGLWWVRGFGGRAARLQRYQPVILRRAGSSAR